MPYLDVGMEELEEIKAKNFTNNIKTQQPQSPVLLAVRPR